MLGFLNDSTVVQKLETLKEKMKTLTARKDDVCAECYQAELQPGKRKRHEVVHWLDTFKLKRSKFESIVDECQQSRSFLTNKQLTDRIDTMTKEVDDLYERSHFPNGLLLDDPKTKQVPFCDLETSYGKPFQENVEKIHEWLSDPLAYSIGVLGMGGVGKTTLLKYIYNQLLEGDNGSKKGRVFWVTVSSDCHLYMLQEKVAEAIGVKLSSEEDVDRRAAALHSSFVKMEENVVLFLDDVWENFQLSSIGIPYKENGGKINIIFSTRKEEVCRSIGCKNYVIRVQSLSEHEAWDLFKNKLETYDSLSSKVQEKAKLVAEECACLPLAIIVIARSMKGVYDMEEWKNALAELKNPSRGNEDMEKDVLRILKFSYDRLSNELLKQCFLSCVLYPEDSMIDKEDLIEGWIMEGLLDDVGSNSDDQMNKGYTLIKQLQNACLLQSYTYYEDKVYEECVEMHDLVRDMAISITNCYPRFLVKYGKQLQEVAEEGLWSQDLVKVSLSFNFDITVIPYGMAPRTPILTVLKLTKLSITEIPEPFFDHMRALKILDLSYTKIKRVPEGVSKLENLRALLLEHCELLTYLPSLAKLTNLRILHLDWNLKFKEGVRGLEGLGKLKEVPYCPWIINDMTGFNGLIQRSHQLSCYRFWLTSRDYIDDNDNQLEFLDTLLHNERGVCITGVEFGEETSLLPTSIQVLIIDKVDIKGKRALTDIFPSLVGALELKIIDLIKCKGLEYIFTRTQPLEALTYLYCTELLNLIRIVKFGSCSFFQLRCLSIFRCPKLKVLFSFNKQFNLPNLKEIEVEECDLLECIFESNNGTLPNLVLSLPNLVRLSLSDLPKLHYIYEGLLVGEKLAFLCIYECPELRVLNESEYVICAASPSTLASISKDAEFWEIFQQHEPLNVAQISYQINQIMKCDTMLVDVDNEIEIKEDKLEWVADLSLSLS